MTSVELVSAPAGLVELGRRFALRVHVFVWRSRLDEQLAAGADPGAGPELTLRAAQLVRRRQRRRLAACAERLVAEYDAGRGYWLSAAIPFLHDQVREARGTLLSLAATLRAADRIEPRGVALLSKLLTDPASPLYVHTASGALQLKAQEALDCLVGVGWGRPRAERPALQPLEGASYGGD